eukprot:Rmarinus@m.10582
MNSHFIWWSESALYDFETSRTRSSLFLRRSTEKWRMEKRTWLVGSATLKLVYSKRLSRTLAGLHITFSTTRGSRRGRKKAKLGLKGEKCDQYYDTLGLKRDATEADIKKNYRERALELHPDKQHIRTQEALQEAERRFKLLAEAYEVLGDPEKRARCEDENDAEDPRRYTKKEQDFEEPAEGEEKPEQPEEPKEEAEPDDAEEDDYQIDEEPELQPLLEMKRSVSYGCLMSNEVQELPVDEFKNFSVTVRFSPKNGDTQTVPRVRFVGALQHAIAMDWEDERAATLMKYHLPLDGTIGFKIYDDEKNGKFYFGLDMGVGFGNAFRSLPSNEQYTMFVRMYVKGQNVVGIITVEKVDNAASEAGYTMQIRNFVIRWMRFDWMVSNVLPEAPSSHPTEEINK